MSSMRSGWLAGAVAAIGIALAAGGCGPGIGGTGTGASAAALVAFQASPASVCSSSFADRLDCTPPGTTNPAPAAGTSVVRFVDASRNLVLEINGNDARLAAGCERLSFDGTFATRAGAALPAFVGSYRPDGGSFDVFAVLTVQRADPTGLTIELSDIDGKRIVAVTTVQRIGAALPPPPGPCP